MANQNSENLHVTCPCCQAKLTVDPVFGAVLSHEAPVRLVRMWTSATRKRSLPNKTASAKTSFPCWFQETNKENILAKKFEEAMKKAKDAPAGKPIRDFDLD